MRCNPVKVIAILLPLFTLLGGSLFAEKDNPERTGNNLESILNAVKQHPTLPHGSFRTWPKAKMAGVDDAGPGEENADFSVDVRYLGYDRRGVVSPGPAVGMTVGLTTFDAQHNSRTARQVAWRGSNDIHIAWIKRNNLNLVVGAGIQLTSYQFWDAVTGTLKWDAYSNFGGDDLHTSSGRSGYCGVDAMTDGRGLPFNHYDPDGLTPYDYYPVIWPDQTKGAGNWGYKQGVPADCLTEDFAHGNTDWTWPYVTMQLYDNGRFQDTVIHIFASESGYTSNNVIRYFRRYGGGPHPESPGLTWDWMTVDTTPTISNIVEAAPPNASHHQGKVALAWAAHFGASYVGDPESGTMEPMSLLLEQNAQDIYCMASEDAGETWSQKYNVTKNDSLGACPWYYYDCSPWGWLPYGDIGGVIDTAGRFHIVWTARPFQNLSDEPGSVIDPQMNYPLFPLASRIYHWSDEGEYYGSALDDNYITIIRDATHDWTDYDSICTGGMWHEMSLNLPQIAQCDNKLYVTFSQFNDIRNGVWDNCHISAWTRNEYIGSANANLYFSISTMNNGGLNWDPARLLTDFTPRCDTAFTTDPGDPVDPMAVNVCHSHFYNSMSRWGMLITGGDDFANAVVVQNAYWDQTESPDYFLDLFYIDDLWPGGVIYGEGMWTVNRVKWFRLPCVDARLDPELIIEPSGIFINTPSWSKPGVVPETEVILKNIGNRALTISNIEIEVEDPPYDPLGNVWLAIDTRGFTGTIVEIVPDNTFTIGVITNADNNTILNGQVLIYGLGDGVGDITETSILRGRLIFHWDGGRVSYLPVEWIIADTVQYNERDTLYTNRIGITIDNNGKYGGGLLDTCGRMDFHLPGNLGLECDTCRAGAGNYQFKYLAEGSPFVVREVDEEARISASVAGHDWFSEVVYSNPAILDGFRPLTGLSWEYCTGFCSYIESGLFCTADSAIGVKNMIIAPEVETIWRTLYDPWWQGPINYYFSNRNDFFVMVTKYFNLTENTIEDIFVGTIEDWDIPSDSSIRNGSYYDLDRKLMYMYGYEADQSDTFCLNDPDHGNDCTDSDFRYGGSAFFGGFRYGGTMDIVNPSDLCEEAQGSFTFKRVNWIGQDVRDHIPAQRLFDTLSGPFWGYNTWVATNPSVGPESLYQDLAMITSYGQFDLGVEDTLVFIKFLASEYNGGLGGIQETIDKARAFTLHYLCCDIWGVPGDADTDHRVNILDIVYIINFLYKYGPGVRWPSSSYDPIGYNEGAGGFPTDNCDALMNVDNHVTGNMKINILDIVYLINYKYKNGPWPTCPYWIY